MLGFPLPYRDELLYSTIVRHGIHSGIVSAKELLFEVFGDTKILVTSDLPSHLKCIAALYPEKIGVTPKSLLYQNTLFPLYAPFVGNMRRLTLIRELTANSKSFVHQRTGVAASRIKQPIYLRYCPGCILEQLNKHGECYWQRGWQATGAESCQMHGYLVDSKLRLHDAHRHQFQAMNLDMCPIIEQLKAEWQSDLMAKSIGELLNLGPIQTPEFSQWSLWYCNLAYKHNFNRGSQVRHDCVREKVVGFWGAKWLSQYGLLPDDTETSWLRSMFRKHRKAFSYLEHLVVLHAFMDSGWKLAKVVDTVVRLESHKKSPGKKLSGTSECELTNYRNKWLTAAEKHGTKQARLNGFGNLYAWLYRRDRQWLMKVNQVYKVSGAQHQKRVDWRKRDVETLKHLILLRDECEMRLDDPRHSSNWYLNRLEHKARIEKHLDLLPLCRLFFTRYCESIFEYQIRRMTRTAIRIKRDGKPLKRWRVLRWSGLSEERLTESASRFLKEVLGI